MMKFSLFGTPFIAWIYDHSFADKGDNHADNHALIVVDLVSSI